MSDSATHPHSRMSGPPRLFRSRRWLAAPSQSRGDPSGSGRDVYLPLPINQRIAAPAGSDTRRHDLVDATSTRLGNHIAGWHVGGGWVACWRGTGITWGMLTIVRSTTHQCGLGEA